MMEDHQCKRPVERKEVDECKGEVFNICSGISPMILEMWFLDKDGTENFFDNWTAEIVNYCPYCGLKSDEK